MAFFTICSGYQPPLAEVATQPIEDRPESSIVGVYDPAERPSAGSQTVSAASIDSLGFHLAIIGLGVFTGYLIHGGVVRVELLVRPPSTDGRAFFDTFPLLPLCMNGWLGGAALLRQLHHAQSARPSPHATPLGHRHGFLGGGRDLDHQRGGGTGGARAVLPPTAWKQLADAQVDGWQQWDPEASPRPVGGELLISPAIR